MAVSSLSAARRACARSGWTLTNLQLQKILYIAHMLHMGRTRGDRLLKRPFEAWDYGPVQPNLYSRVRIFGSDPVQDIFFSAPDIDSEAEAEVIDTSVDILAPKKPSQLVAMTHRTGSAWAKNYRAGVHGIVIPDEDIIAEYDRFFRKAA
jgi:uncharacterized phage-associated protein